MRLNTYSQVWGLKRVFYHIQKLKLPFPISLPEMFIFVLTEVLFISIFRHIPLPFIFKYALIPFGITWALSRMELEERPPHYFFLSVLRYMGRPHLMAKGLQAERKRVIKTAYTSLIEWDGRSERDTGTKRDI